MIQILPLAYDIPASGVPQFRPWPRASFPAGVHPAALIDILIPPQFRGTQLHLHVDLVDEDGRHPTLRDGSPSIGVTITIAVGRDLFPQRGGPGYSQGHITLDTRLKPGGYAWRVRCPQLTKKVVNSPFHVV